MLDTLSPIPSDICTYLLKFSCFPFKTFIHCIIPSLCRSQYCIRGKAYSGWDSDYYDRQGADKLKPHNCSWRRVSMRSRESTQSQQRNELPQSIPSQQRHLTIVARQPTSTVRAYFAFPPRSSAISQGRHLISYIHHLFSFCYWHCSQSGRAFLWLTLVLITTQ